MMFKCKRIVSLFAVSLVKHLSRQPTVPTLEHYMITLIPLVSTHFRSFFGKAFEQAANSTNSRILHDNFDTFSKYTLSVFTVCD